MTSGQSKRPLWSPWSQRYPGKVSKVSALHTVTFSSCLPLEQASAWRWAGVRIRGVYFSSAVKTAPEPLHCASGLVCQLLLPAHLLEEVWG